MSNPPFGDRGAQSEASGLPDEDSYRDASQTGEKAEARQSHRSLPKPRSQARTDKAISEAQQSLHSLLNPQKDDDQPQVISQSGTVRSQKRGRVAGPTADTHRIAAPGNVYTPGEQLPEAGKANTGTSLSTSRGSNTAPDDMQPGDFRSIPRSRVALGVARAGTSVQAARDRMSLLIDSPEQAGALGLDVQVAAASRRSASQWATRYATHLVILLVVGVIVVVGGLKVFTVQGAYSRPMGAAQAYSGTDLVGDDQSTNAQPDGDAQNFALAMPRTTLSTAPQANGKPAPVPASATVTKYTVVEGDTLDSIAARFNVMPETVMGSNGIFDPEEILVAGRTLVIPPVDGMYYVARKGDTVDSVARRFQADPAAVTAYAPNKIGADGAIKEGQALVVPGGMMPEREATVAYTVRQGDTLKGIASRYGVDVPTMLYSNNIPDPDNLQPGMNLRILPVPGIEYKVKKGDTILAIADRLGVSPQMILDYSPNHLTVSSKLQIDQVIMVPGGSPEQPKQDTTIVAAARIEPAARSSSRPPAVSQPVQPPKAASNPQPKPRSSSPPAVAKPKTTSNSVQVGTGRLMWPVNAVITQYFSSYHNGLDLAAPAGTPIHAADAGKVVWSGWRTDGLGYCVIIDHLDGLTTVYGHQIKQPIVYVGQYVSRGQIIGYVGSTGHSTGPHVHFMVKAGSEYSRNYRNPLAYLGG